MIKGIISIVAAILIINGTNVNISLETNKNIVEEITNENFEEKVIQEKELVLVDFYATWCNPCNKLAPVIEEIAKEEREIKVIKIDVDKEPELKEKYEIYAVPTMIIIKDGEEKERHIGPLEKQEIKEWIEKNK